jgi:hypothetical protein
VPGLRNLLRTLRELGFPAENTAGGRGAAALNGRQTQEPVDALTESTSAADAQGQPDRQLSVFAGAILREYEAWLGDWDDACRRAARGGTEAQDTIFTFARLRTAFPHAESMMDDETIEALRALPWDSHHRALLGFDVDARVLREQAERRISQACAILGEVALAVPTQGDYQARLRWLQRIATAQGKQAQEALLAALLAPPDQPLLDCAAPQGLHAAAAVVGRLCARARLPAGGPVTGAVAALGTRASELLTARPQLATPPAGELPHAAWLLPLSPEIGAEDQPSQSAGSAAALPEAALRAAELRALCARVSAVEAWYTSAAASLRAAAAERPVPRVTRAAGLSERRLGGEATPSGSLDAEARIELIGASTAAARMDLAGASRAAARGREDIAPQRAASVVDDARARAQLVRESLQDAARQLDRADAGTWVHVVATAQRLDRWLAPVVRGWVEADPAVTPLVRAATEAVAQIAAMTAPPIPPAPPAPPELALQEVVEAPAAAEPLPEPAEALGVVEEHEAFVEESAWLDPLEPSEPVVLPAAEASTAASAESTELSEPAERTPKRSRAKAAPKDKAATRRAPTSPAKSADRPKRSRRKSAPTEPVEEPVAAEMAPAEEPIGPVAERPDESVAEAPVAEAPVAEEPFAKEPVAEEPVAEEPVVEDTVALAPPPEVAPAPPASAPAPAPPSPSVDWTPQINEVREIARLWTTQPSNKSRNGRDPEREALIGRLNELVWPIVGAGISGHSPEARAIRETLEVSVSDATRYSSRQHDVACGGKLDDSPAQRRVAANVDVARGVDGDAHRLVVMEDGGGVEDLPAPFPAQLPAWAVIRRGAGIDEAGARQTRGPAQLSLGDILGQRRIASG